MLKDFLFYNLQKNKDHVISCTNDHRQIMSKVLSGHVTRQFNVVRRDFDTYNRKKCIPGEDDNLKQKFCVDYGLQTDLQALEEGK